MPLVLFCTAQPLGTSEYFGCTESRSPQRRHITTSPCRRHNHPFSAPHSVTMCPPPPTQCMVPPSLCLYGARYSIAFLPRTLLSLWICLLTQSLCRLTMSTSRSSLQVPPLRTHLLSALPPNSSMLATSHCIKRACSVCCRGTQGFTCTSSQSTISPLP
jgi:hypothetical protein